MNESIPIVPYVQKVQNLDEKPKQDFNVQIVELMTMQQIMNKKNLMFQLSNLIISIFIFIFLIVIIFLGSK